MRDDWIYDLVMVEVAYRTGGDVAWWMDFGPKWTIKGALRRLRRRKRTVPAQRTGEHERVPATASC